GIGAGRRKQAVDLPPGEKYESGKQYECDRISSEVAKQQDAGTFQNERKEHRMLAAQPIRYPAEERPGDAVQHAVDRQREREGRQAQAEYADWHIGNLKIFGDW